LFKSGQLIYVRYWGRDDYILIIDRMKCLQIINNVPRLLRYKLQYIDYANDRCLITTGISKRIRKDHEWARSKVYVILQII
jgi:hypothetical protein